MPSKKSAIKELVKSEKKHLRNVSRKKLLKKEEKKIIKLINTKDTTNLKTALPNFISKLDKAVTKGLMHKSKASRRQSQLHKKLNQLEA